MPNAKTTRIFRNRSHFVAATLCVLTFCAFSSRATVDAATFPTIVTQAQQAFSAGAEVKTLSLTGTVTWTTGSTIDSGTFTLTASEDGSSTMSLQMDAHGAYKEIYGAAGIARSCQWQGADDVVHSADSSSCALPVAWFLPSISLQPTAPNIAVSDNGLISLESSSFHVLSLSTPGAPSQTSLGMPADFGVESLNLDPTTLLPASTKHRLFSGMNHLSPIAVEVDYSQYAQTDGVQIPRSIVRHLNGAVDLDFTVTNVTVG